METWPHTEARNLRQRQTRPNPEQGEREREERSVVRKLCSAECRVVVGLSRRGL